MIRSMMLVLVFLSIVSQLLHPFLDALADLVRLFQGCHFRFLIQLLDLLVLSHQLLLLLGQFLGRRVVLHGQVAQVSVMVSGGGFKRQAAQEP